MCVECTCYAKLIFTILDMFGAGPSNCVCPDCRGVEMRMERMKEKNKELVVNWRCKAVGEARVEFFRRAVGLFGEGLKKELSDSLAVLTTNESIVEWQGEGTWLDEDDLKKELKGKQAQVDEVLKSANTFFHPTRKVTLS